MLRSEFADDVTAILNEGNPGFAGANNQGIAIARGRYVLLLNPDTLILDGAIDTCVAYADELRDARVGVLGCQVWEDAETIQKTCFQFPSPLNTLLNMLGLTQRYPSSRFFGRADMGWWDRRDEREVDVVSGMFMLVRREALEQVGPDGRQLLHLRRGSRLVLPLLAARLALRVHAARPDHAPRGRRQEHRAGQREDVRAAAQEPAAVPSQEPRPGLLGAGPGGLRRRAAAALRRVRLPGAHLPRRPARKFRQALAATRYHLFRIEPQS